MIENGKSERTEEENVVHGGRPTGLQRRKKKEASGDKREQYSTEKLDEMGI